MKFSNIYGMFIHHFLQSPHSVSDGAVCLYKFHQLLYNTMIVNTDNFFNEDEY